MAFRGVQTRHRSQSDDRLMGVGAPTSTVDADCAPNGNRDRCLARIMTDPYSSPETRQLAHEMLLMDWNKAAATPQERELIKSFAQQPQTVVVPSRLRPRRYASQMATASDTLFLNSSRRSPRLERGSLFPQTGLPDGSCRVGFPVPRSLYV